MVERGLKLIGARSDALSRVTGILLDVYATDYAISFILACVANDAQLGKTLVFKEGTALRKCYFGDYRFSEDLDFSELLDL